MLPDATKDLSRQEAEIGLNAPTGAWCSLTTSPQGQTWVRKGLNAPTGAWCSLTQPSWLLAWAGWASQCTYRCVVLPDATKDLSRQEAEIGLNAPTGAWCSLTTSPQGQTWVRKGLNAPTGAWCSLTQPSWLLAWAGWASQCTYRCVVLPDAIGAALDRSAGSVSMHLQVRGAP